MKQYTVRVSFVHFMLSKGGRSSLNVCTCTVVLEQGGVTWQSRSGKALSVFFLLLNILYSMRQKKATAQKKDTFLSMLAVAV
jgi:hypothetical protein